MLDSSLTEDTLWAALPTLQDPDLPALLDHPAAHERHILKVLIRTDLTAEFLNSVARGRWIRNPQIQAAFVNHPRAPRGDALNFVKFLFWRDLNRTILNFRAPPEVRHAAESNLMQRLPGLTVGEKMTLARTTGGQVLKALRLEGDGRIIRSLLENSRTVEEDVLFLVSRPRCPTPVLEMVAQNVKWHTRKEVRIALLRNPHTPLAVALGFITRLTTADLKALSSDAKVPLAVRRAIARRIGEA